MELSNFYPRPPRGGRRETGGQNVEPRKISIHALREEGDTPTSAGASRPHNFYPRPPRGGRHMIYLVCCTSGIFLSTPSARRATMMIPASIPSPLKFLSTPSARRATDDPLKVTSITVISIHALREEGDSDHPASGRQQEISIHALREEGDPATRTKVTMARVFLSTPSARRATFRNPCQPLQEGISIHALREEGDRLTPTATRSPANFYPRPPRGGRP